jgi:hypothetical protein
MDIAVKCLLKSSAIRHSIFGLRGARRGGKMYGIKNTDLKRGRADKFTSSKFHNGLKNHAHYALKIN